MTVLLSMGGFFSYNDLKDFTGKQSQECENNENKEAWRKKCSLIKHFSIQSLRKVINLDLVEGKSESRLVNE